MKTKPIKIEEITKVIDPIVAMAKQQWFLATAEVDGVAATLTCAWGAFGNVWNKNAMTIYVRPQRHTLPFIQKSGRFTATFFDGHLQELGYLGTVTGYEVPDKIEKSGLHLTHIDGNPTFEEGKYVIVCRVIYQQRLEKDLFVDQTIPGKSYPTEDYSYMIVGEIEAAYEIEA